MTLAERLLAVHAGLAQARIPHAFGGALALAYWTEEPRGTRDIDLNVFLSPSGAGRVRRALPDGVAWTDDADRAIARDGQARVMWDDTPIDLFFDYAPIHSAAARNHRIVPFTGTVIPVLGPVELAAFKVVFDRTRDWADIEDMIRTGSLDTASLRGLLDGMLDAEDPRLVRLAKAESRARTDG